MRLCHACGKAIPLGRLKAVPSATLCVPCLISLGDVLPIKRFDEACVEGIVESYFTRDLAFESQIHRERTHAVTNKVLAEITESDVIEPMAAEIKADERSTRTVAAIIDEQAEEVV